MNGEVLVFAQVCAVIVAVAGSLAGIGIFTAHALRGVRRPHPPQDDIRLERLQQSVDAIAVEVERIAEAQRFSAKLLAERSDAIR